MDVPELRKKIDELDDKILKAIDQRLAIAKKLIGQKQQEGKPLFDSAREESIILHLKQASTLLPPKSLEKIYFELFSISRSFYKTLTASYLGPEGSFSHLAAKNRFGLEAKYLPCRSIHQVFAEVEAERADFGVIPIENSNEGVVTDTLSNFLQSNLTIVGEVYESISHHLACQCEFEQIQKIYSHPQALGQCRAWIAQNLPHVEVEEASSTAQAAKKASSEKSSAAICSKLAAEIWGLNILQSDIQDFKENTTRFYLIGKQIPPKGKKNKTLVLFSTENKAGALYKALGYFQREGVNMTMIESKRRGQTLWDYLFFVDLEGHQEDPHLKKALGGLKKIAPYFKILGSYPIDHV